MKSKTVSMIVGALLSTPIIAQEKELNLESTFQGNREQPRVLYIVPWQQPGGPPELARPIDGELDQLFEPIDRTSFQRELKYIKFLQDGDQKTDNPQLFE
ncbi:MAG: hypothetical protein AB8B86_00880 [Pseudomonadales bacterium]